MTRAKKPLREDARVQLVGYLLGQRDDQRTTREWIETWLDAHCKSTRRSLDARTLRTVARRLRGRAHELDRKNKRNKALIGESPSLVRVGRANECDLQADNMLNEARAVERKAKASKSKGDGK